MTDYSEYFLASPPSVVKLDCLEIAHPDFSQTYRIVRNAPDGVTVVQGGDPVTDWLFDGVDDQIRMGNVLSKERTDAFSAGIWFKTTTSADRKMLSKVSSATGNRGWQLYVSGGDVFFQLIHDNTGGSSDILQVKSNASSNDDSWHFAMCTYSGSSANTGLNLYVDGSLVSQSRTGGPLTQTTVSAAILQIAGFDTTGSFPGRLQHGQVWGRVLTAPEVAEAYNSGTSPNLLGSSMAAALEGWWKIDETDTADTNGVTDHSANSFDGTSTFDPVTTPSDEVTYDYYPARVLPMAASDDMVQSLSVTLGDVGDVIAHELARLWESNGLETRPTVTYRCFRSDDLSAALQGPIEGLEIVNVTTSKEGASFEAQARELNATRTGERYTVERFPMLRGFF